MVERVIADESGIVIAVGTTVATDHPTTTGAFQGTFAGGTDIVIACLSPTGDAALYATYFGGSSNERSRAAIQEPGGDLFVVGSTISANFPSTQGAAAPPFNPNCTLPVIGPVPCSDAFVARVDLLPAGVTRFGSQTATCGGRSPYTLISPAPLAGTTASIICSEAPPVAQGLLAIGLAVNNPPLLGAGFALHLDLRQPFLLLPLSSDAAGFTSVSLPIPPGTTGQTVYLQHAWANSLGCPITTGALSASNALMVTIQ